MTTNNVQSHDLVYNYAQQRFTKRKIILMPSSAFFIQVKII